MGVRAAARLIPKGARLTVAAAQADHGALLITRVQLDGRSADVRIRHGVVTQIAPALTREAHEDVVAAAGGALLPGLHDHHVHLLAMAAARDSVPVGPPAVRDGQAFAQTVRSTSARMEPGRWLRAVGYHESVAGPLDRDVLDRLEVDRPLRIQHRSGGLWILNSAGVRAAGLESLQHPDVERDERGRLTGRLWRWDAGLRAALDTCAGPPELAAVSRTLAGFGITGVSDATPDLDAATVAAFGAAVADSTFPQRLTLLGSPLAGALPAGLRAGPFKLLLHDHDLPTLEVLSLRIRAAHDAGRAVAVHCVTRESLLLTLAALDEAGHRSGDRIEHAAVVPPEIRQWLVAAGVRVVTQPAFVAERGDQYLTDVEPDDRACLYPFASLLAAGLPVAASSDAPFGAADPWRVIAAARDRRTPKGHVVGPDERVSAETALAGYLTDPALPGGTPRRIRVGAAADLCLLRVPLAAALAEPSAEQVALVTRAGRPIWRAG